MSIRIKLLLLSLLTLVLPWAGWQYAQQMETTLRTGQEVSVLTTAQVLARVLANEPQLRHRADVVRHGFDANRGDLFAPLLNSAPLLDGFSDEWPTPTRTVPGIDPPPASGTHVRPLIRIGIHGRLLHAYVQVQASHVRYETRDATTDADRVVLLTRDTDGQEFAWCISALAPGPFIARDCDIGAPWQPRARTAREVSGVWRETNDGYAVELRMPVENIGTQLAVYALDAQARTIASTPLARLHTGSQTLQDHLQRYVPAGLRIAVVDTQGWLLARAGHLEQTPSIDRPGLRSDDYGFLRSIYRELLPASARPAQSYGLPYGMWGEPVDAALAGEPQAIWFEQFGGEPALVRAAVPIDANGHSLGALIVEQPGEELVMVREQALTRLLNLTLMATAFTVIIALAFAARLSQRIRRLSLAATTALTAEGQIEADIPETAAGDELGALARSYDTLLRRLKEYTSYLQTLGTKLSHELRTPLTIVSSSLDNLASDGTLTPQAQSYLERARTGTNRMHAILSALSEATRVEQSIEHTEIVRFDLSELLRDITQAYQQTLPVLHIDLQGAAHPCLIDGSPDLIAQLLDKLMDNASDFTPAGGHITLALQLRGPECELSVSNEGPPLPAHLQGRWFESLTSSRDSTADKPHLGLGLYIARLIADFHGGQLLADNLEDGRGVRITLLLPRA